MEVKVVRHALDRVPLSLIIDDATLLFNLNYFWMRDRNPVDGRNRRWEDVPVIHPESFTREWAEWCLEAGVRGKFSVVPCPAAIGRIDHPLPLISEQQQESWLRMCREVIMPAFDITPEMITHTKVVDPATCRPLESGIWEQFDWATLPVDQFESMVEYIATACRILDNVGLTPTGVTSPGGFGGRTLDFYARVAGEAVRQVTGNPTPFFFQRLYVDQPTDTPVWYPDRTRGEAVGEVIAGTDDLTGNWTGYGAVSADYYITADGQGGRLPELINAGDPAILCSHWQGMYGLSNDDRRGFRTLKTVVRRLQMRDPYGEHSRWRKCSEITRYAIARAMATISVKGDTIQLDLPVQVPEFTLRLASVMPREIRVNDVPLQRVRHRAAFESGTWYIQDEAVLLAFDVTRRKTTLKVTKA